MKRTKKFWQLMSLTIGIVSVASAVQVQDISEHEEIAPTIEPLTARDSLALMRFVKQGCQDSTYFLNQVNDWQGVVGYREDLKSYVIIYGIEGTIDSQYTGILCNCAKARKWNGKTVKFTGRYFRAPGINIKYGGESVAYLYLKSVKVLRGK